MTEEAPARRRIPPWLRPLIWLAACFLGYSLAGFYGVPWLVRHLVQSRLPRVVHRPVQVGAVSFHPFLLQLTVRDLAVGSEAGWRRLFVDVDWRSLWEGAVALAAVHLDEPYARLGRDQAGQLTIADLLAGPPAAAETPAAPTRPGLPLMIDDLRLTGGGLDFLDGVTGTRHRVDLLALAVPSLSLRPEDSDRPLRAVLACLVNGAPVKLRGHLRPLAADRRGRVEARFGPVDPAFYLAYAPPLPGLSLRPGRLSGQLVADLYRDAAGDQLILAGDLALGRSSVADTAGRTFFHLEGLTVRLTGSNLLAGSLRLDRLALMEPRLTVVRSQDGDLSPLSLVPAASGKADRQPAGPGLDLAIAELAVTGGALSFADETVQPPFATQLQDLTIRLQGLALPGDQPAELTLAGRTGAGETLSVAGHLQPASRAMRGRLALAGLPLAHYLPYGRPYLASGVEVAGTAACDAGFEVTAAGTANLRLQDLSLSISDLAVRQGKIEALSLGRIALTGLALDTGASTLAARELRLAKGRVALTRQADGQMSLQGLLARTSRPGKSTAKGAASSSPGLALRLDRLAVEGVGLDFTDASTPVPVRLALSDLGLQAGPLLLPPKETVRVELGAKVGKGGKLSVHGSLDAQAQKARLAVDLRGLGLAAFQGYIDPWLKILVKEGQAMVEGELELAAGRGSPAASFRGRLAVDRLRALDPLLGEDLLAWERLAAGPVRFTTTPPRLAITEVDWRGLTLHPRVQPDGQLNLLGLVREGPASRPGAQPEPTGQPLGFALERLRLAKGGLTFLDQSVQPHYAARLDELAGEVTGLATTPEASVAFALQGMVDRHAPLAVHGAVQPFGERVAGEVTITCKGLDLTPTTPYTEKFVGYRTDRGKLSLDLSYTIKDGVLTGNNHAFLDQFLLGEQVASPDAVQLPLQLAVALLKNRKGEITLNIPVQGRTDDPEFNLGQVIATALFNLIAKAVTAPFALLAALIPEGKEVSFVGFQPGLAQVRPEGLEKAVLLAQAIRDRPGLKVELAGLADPVVDAQALAEARFQRMLRVQKLRQTGGQGEPESVTIGAEEYGRYLAAAYREAGLPRPRNLLGIPRDPPPAEMEAALRQRLAVPATELAKLAGERATVLQDLLIEQGPVEPARIFLSAPAVAEAVSGPEGVGGSRVDVTLR
ncbi:MAG: DUF748 domain-containing protein [Thermodesulfobacteriota bacterium]